MATAEHGQDYQRWLAKINQVCGHFAARPLEGRFHGEIDASLCRHAESQQPSPPAASICSAPATKLSAAMTTGFIPSSSSPARRPSEQDDRQVVLDAGDITLIDASRPCSIFWQQTSRQASLLLPRQLLEQQLRGSEISIATRLEKSLPMVQLSQRLLQESMCSPELSESESAAALEAIVLPAASDAASSRPPTVA
ncbi:Transcriptional activator feaR [Raoultella ornithinolytica]|nr:Transcriptional activator feaR [Raoultella ornithinolytica]